MSEPFSPRTMEQPRGISWLPPVIARGVHAIKVLRKAVRARDDDSHTRLAKGMDDQNVRAALSKSCSKHVRYSFLL